MSVKHEVKNLVLPIIYSLPLRMRRWVLYVYYQRRTPSFTRPQLFSEKINWRILNDRRDVLAWTCDKLRVKEHGATHGAKSPKTYWSGIDVGELAGVDLPAHWVLKPNHRSALVHFGHGKVDNVDALRAITTKWLEGLQGQDLGEWAYTQARSLLIVEEMLGDGERAPSDFRFFTYSGQPRYVQVEFDSHEPDEHTRSFYTIDWQILDVTQVYPQAAAIPRPPNFEEMVRLAGAVGAAFDFVRVDLYNLDGDIYLGEVTPYPTGGLSRFRPRSFDRELGTWWRLPSSTGGPV